MEVNWEAIDDYLKRNQKIMAVKEYRAQTHAGLREAKTAVDLREYNLGMVGFLRLKGQNSLDEVNWQQEIDKLMDFTRKFIAVMTSNEPRYAKLVELNCLAGEYRQISDYLSSLV